MATPRILAFAGSARADSFNKRLLRVVTDGARSAGADVTVVDLRDLPLPLFDQDVEAREGEPANAKRLKDLMRSAGGFLIASPEHNGTYSALMKNTLDWASRRRDGEKPLECFAGKLAAVCAASPGPLGGMRGLFQLRYLLGILGVTVLAEQVTVGRAGEAFGADGSLLDEKSRVSATALGASLATALARLRAG